MKKRIIKLFLIIAFTLFFLIVLQNNSFCAEYCQVITNGKTYNIDSDSATKYVEDKVYYGEKVKVKIRTKARGIDKDDKNTCWINKTDSRNVSATNYGAVTVHDIKWATNEAEFEIEFGFFSQKATSARVRIEFGVEGTSKVWSNHIIEFINISDELYEKKLLENQAKNEENKQDMLENYYKTDISELDDATEKRDYLRSVLYNDNKNGNHDLWNKFVDETTPEQRKNWSYQINQLRGEDDGILEVKKALNKQIQMDEGEVTQEERDEFLDQGR